MPSTGLWEQLQPFMLSLAIGLLMGLERERRPGVRAGLRTFALVSLLGSVSAMLSAQFGSAWPLAAGLIATAALIIAAYIGQPADAEPGTTSVVALMLCYALGALIWLGHAQLGVTLGIAATVLLYFKAELRGIASRLDARDYISILQFGVLSLVILPLLPNQDYGPYNALNPHQIWLMVVLISGVSLAGYAALRIAGAQHGAPVIGVFGGLVSSTATTMVFARHARADGAMAQTASVVILLANLVMMLRLGGLTAVIAPGLLPEVAAALGGGFTLGLVSTLFFWRQMGRQPGLPMPEVRNPTEIRSALGFGFIYALVLLMAAWLSDLAGNRGLYVVSLVSGLTDVDAITLTSLRMHGMNRLSAIDATTAIALAVLANLGFKSVLAGVIGGPGLVRRILPGMCAVAIGVAAGLLVLRA